MTEVHHNSAPAVTEHGALRESGVRTGAAMTAITQEPLEEDTH